MKKINLLTLLLLFPAAIAIAQYQPGSKLVTFTGGWSLMNISESSNSTGGFQTGGSFEQTSFNGNWAYGVALNFIRVTDETSNGKAMYRTTPFTFQGKYLFGGSSTRAFGQANFGLHNSKVEWDSRVILQNWDYGVVIGGGIGTHMFLSDKVFITVAYNINWLQNSYYKNGVLHTFLGGIGFQFP